MAIIHPRLVQPHTLPHGGYQLELNLLEMLRTGLPDTFDVFHGLTWSTVHSSVQKFGELDLTVVSPQGQILILEVKAGSVYTNNGSIYKDYSQQKPKDIGQQLGRQHGALKKRLKQANMGTRQTFLMQRCMTNWPRSTWQTRPTSSLGLTCWW